MGVAYPSNWVGKSIGIEFPKEDAAALMKQMERARKLLGKDLKGSIISAMKYVMQSLAVSTKVSQKYRAYTELPKKSRSGLNSVFAVATKYQTPRRKGKALRRSWQGDWREQRIYAKNEAELKKRPAVIIAMRGLAKESWKAAGARNKMRITSADKATGKTGAIMRKAARRWVTAVNRLTGEDPYMQVTNELAYMENAINGGNSTINSSLARAARAMEHSIDRQLAARMGAA